MKTLSKKHKDYIETLINKGDKKSLVAYCEGANIDINDMSSPVCLTGFKVAIRYRGEMSYHFIF